MKAYIGQLVALTAVILLAATFGQAAEMVDNPAYQDWSRFKVGTFVAYTMKTKAQDQEMASEMTHKLVELTKERAVVEISIAMSVAGQNMTMPGQRIVHPAKISKDEQKPDGDPNTPKFTVKSGEETIQAAGKSFKCDWGEITTTQNGMTMKGKSWICKDVPSGLVKMEAKGDQGGEKFATSMLLSALKIAE